MPFDDHELVMISALEHWRYCPRQCALIHIEQSFDENLYTLRGRILHRKVDQPGGETVEGLRVERAMPLWSDRLGLIGKADVVEFHPHADAPSPPGTTEWSPLPTGEGKEWRPYPVEYKVGRRRAGARAAVVLQLCAQAMCLEEMTGTAVPAGAVYFHGSRRRKEIVFTPAMRDEVAVTTLAVRRMLAEGQLPPPLRDARCKLCSLKESCLPEAAGEAARVRAATRRLFQIEEG
jgi:CRISPR-associated exonuclease Cas4